MNKKTFICCLVIALFAAFSLAFAGGGTNVNVGIAEEDYNLLVGGSQSLIFNTDAGGRTEIISNIQPSDPIQGFVGSAGAITELGNNLVVWYDRPGYTTQERLSPEQIKERQHFFTSQESGKYYNVGPNTGDVLLMPYKPRGPSDKQIGFFFGDPNPNIPIELAVEFKVSDALEKTGSIEESSGQAVRVVVAFQVEYITEVAADTGGVTPSGSGIIGTTAVGIAPGYSKTKNVTRAYKINQVYVYVYNPGPVPSYSQWWAKVKGAQNQQVDAPKTSSRPADILFDKTGLDSKFDLTCRAYASEIYNERWNIGSRKIVFWAIGLPGLKDKFGKTMAWKVAVRTGQFLTQKGFTDAQLRNIFRINYREAVGNEKQFIINNNSTGYVTVKPAG